MAVHKTLEDRNVREEIKNELSIGANLGGVLNALSGEEAAATGVEPSQISGESGFAFGGPGASGLGNEGSGLSMGGARGKAGVLDVLVQASVIGLGEKLNVPAATENLSTAPMTKVGSQQAITKFTLSPNQHQALQKFPALIDFLGQPDGEKIAHKIASEVNIVLASRIRNNSHEAHEFALDCESENQNLKQYFKGADWVCRVTASGPFRGDEAIYYYRDNDMSFILRKDASGYIDVTKQFNVIHEAKAVAAEIHEDSDLEIVDETD